MIDYTKAAVNKLISDFKRFFYFFQIGAYIVYILYLVYALISQRGIVYVNVILLLLTAAYLTFFICYRQSEMQNKRLKQTVKTIFKWSKRGIKLFTIGVALYGIYYTAKEVTVISVVLSAFMLIGFILDILFEAVICFVTNKINFVYEAIQADVQTTLKPVTTVGNFFKKLKGEEVEVKEPTKNRMKLDELVAIAKAEKQQKKADERQAKKEKKRKRKEKKQAPSLAEETLSDEKDDA